MKCPFCSFEDSRVIDSRSVESGASIRRRRECPKCGRRFTTYEKYEETPLVVSKKDGRRELFDGGKLFGGLLKAFEKRPVSTETVQDIAHEIERELRLKGESELKASRKLPAAKSGNWLWSIWKRRTRLRMSVLHRYTDSLRMCRISCRNCSGSWKTIRKITNRRFFAERCFSPCKH